MNALLAQAKTTTVDHTKVTEGITFETPPAGPTMARLVGYVEVGKQPQEFDGKPKNPALECYVFFELNSKKHMRTFEVDGVEKTSFNRIQQSLPVYTNSKAGFHKLFESMRAGRDGITHMAHMLGEPFKIDVVHNTVGEGDKKKTYANMKDANGWKIGPPMVTKYNDEGEPVETVMLPVPEPTQSLMLLLWDTPSKEQWDSIFIDGVRKTKVNGVETEVSKNWLQELCMKAVDFKGSAVEGLLTGGDALADELAGGMFDDLVPDPAPETSAQKPADKPAPEVKQETKAADKPAPTPNESKSADDVLAGLGL
jgi:hypothetical protein